VEKFYMLKDEQNSHTTSPSHYLSTNASITTKMSKPAQIPSTTPYAFPHTSTFSPATTALIIIDMQNDFLSPGGYLASQNYSLERFTPLIPRLQSMLSTFRRAHFPIYHTREGHKPDMSTVSSRELHRSAVNGARIGEQGPLGRLLIRGEKGHEIIEEMRPVEGEVVIDKPGRGAFTHTELDASLRARGIVNLVVCGVTADACVSSTVREASDRGYDVCVLEDGVESVSEELKMWALEAIRIEGGLFGVTCNCESMEETVKTWINDAGSELGDDVKVSSR
jgi:nicotinamidase-related amidase